MTTGRNTHRWPRAAGRAHRRIGGKPLDLLKRVPRRHRRLLHLERSPSTAASRFRAYNSAVRYTVSTARTDSEGNIYTTETYEGKRVQMFMYMGHGNGHGADHGVVWPGGGG